MSFASTIFVLFLCALPWSAVLIAGGTTVQFPGRREFIEALLQVAALSALWLLTFLLLKSFVARIQDKNGDRVVGLGALVLPVAAAAQWLSGFPLSRAELALVTLVAALAVALIALRIKPTALAAISDLSFGKREWPMIVVIFLAAAVYFAPVFLDHQVISPNGFLYIWPPFRSYVPPGTVDYNTITSDFTDSLFPQYAAAREAILSTGRLPLTNDSNLSTVHYGSFLGSSLYSLDFLFILLLGISWGPTAAIIFRVVAGGVLSYCYLRLFEVVKPAALLAAIVFMFCAMSAVNLFLPYLFNIPLLLFTTELLFRKRRYIYTAPVVFAYVSVMLSGQIIWSIHIITLQALYVAFRLALSRESLRLKLHFLGCLIFSGSAALLLLSFLFLPSIEHYRSLDLGYRANNSGHYHGYEFALMFLYPLIGGPMTVPFTWGGNAVEYCFYLGIATLLLLFGLLSGRSSIVGLFWLAIAALIYAITTNTFDILDLVRKIPFYHNSSNTRLRFLWAFAAAAAAAFGLHALLINSARRPGRILAMYLCLVTAGALSLYAVRDRYAASPTLIAFNEPQIASHMYWQTIVIALFVCVIGWIICARSKTVPTLILLPLAFFDLHRATADYVSYLDPELNYPQMEVTDFLRSRSARTGGRILPVQRAFIANFQMPYGLSSVQPRGFYSTAEKQLIQQLDPGALAVHPTMYFFDLANTNYQSPVLDLLNVQFLVFAPGNYGAELEERLGERWTLVYDKELKVFENRGSPQPAFLVRRAEVVPDPSDRVSRLGTINPYEVVLFEESTALWPEKAEEGQPVEFATGRGDATLVSSAHDSDVFKTADAGPGYLVYSRFYHPAWKAYIDGVETPVHRADHALMGIRVPAGQHTITFAFEPWLVTEGRLLSGSVFVILVIFYAGLLMRRETVVLPHGAALSAAEK